MSQNLFLKLIVTITLVSTYSCSNGTNKSMTKSIGSNTPIYQSEDLGITPPEYKSQDLEGINSSQDLENNDPMSSSILPSPMSSPEELSENQNSLFPIEDDNKVAQYRQDSYGERPPIVMLKNRLTVQQSLTLLRNRCLNERVFNSHDAVFNHSSKTSSNISGFPSNHNEYRHQFPNHADFCALCNKVYRYLNQHSFACISRSGIRTR